MTQHPTSGGSLAAAGGQSRARSEPELRAMIVEALCASGIALEEQLVCAAGTADIVTARRDAVIEVKLDLARRQIQWAVGQVLLYCAAISPNARAIVSAMRRVRRRASLTGQRPWAWK